MPRRPENKPGEKLLSMMAEREPPIRKSRLARDLGVSPTTIDRWFRQIDDGSLDEGPWARVATTLRDKYKIPADEIRPILATVASPSHVLDASLLGHLDHFTTPETLGALVQILDGSANQSARDLLLIVARDRLQRHPKR